MNERKRQIEARRVGKEKGVKFRKYDHWAPFCIKSYGPGPMEYNDFRNWREALEWVRGI